MTADDVAAKIDWTSLVNAIKSNDCVLALGPNIASFKRGEDDISLPQLLAEFLAEKLLKIKPDLDLRAPADLNYMAKQVEAYAIPQGNYSREKARARLVEWVKEFYESRSHAAFPVFKMLARLPFSFIVNTCPDDFLSKALDDEDKFNATVEYYHFSNHDRNNKTNIIEEEISSDTPLVYHLFGSVADPDSMVLTESDQLKFMDSLLQKEVKSTVPTCVSIHFTAHSEFSKEKSFLFLGFDFNHWHLRLLMHFINRVKQQKATYALQNPHNLSALTAFFYESNFDVKFVDAPPMDFLHELERQLKTADSQRAEAAPKLKVYLMYDQADEEKKDKLEAQLAPLRRSALIQSWDEEQIAAGMERTAEIERHLAEADIVILVVTARFFASDEIYEWQLQKALQRAHDRQTTIIPVLMGSCLWQGSVLEDWKKNIQPKSGKAVDAFENQDDILSVVVAQIGKICHKIFERKSKS